MENYKNKKFVKFQGDMLNFCDFIQVFVFTRNHHLKTDHDFVFSGRNKWLGCDVTTNATSGKFCLEKHPYFFAAYAVDETDRRESSIGLETNNEGTDVDASYFSVYRSSAYGSKQSVSADSGYGTDGGVIQE